MRRHCRGLLPPPGRATGGVHPKSQEYHPQSGYVWKLLGLVCTILFQSLQVPFLHVERDWTQQIQECVTTTV